MKKLGFKDGFMAGLGFYASQFAIGIIFIVILSLLAWLFS